MRIAPLAVIIGLLLAIAPAPASDFGQRHRGGGFRAGSNRGFSGGVLRVNSRYLGRGLNSYSRRQSLAASGYGGYGSYAVWRLYRNRSRQVDSSSYGRCYWRGYYRPRLYCRKYNSRYSYYKSVHPAPGRSGLGARAAYPGGYAATRYPIGYSRGYGGGYSRGYGDAYGSGRQTIYQSRYGYRNPHNALAAGAFAAGSYGYDGGAGPYGFYDPYGYRLLPAFNFAPILMRLTTVYTIDDPAFDGEDAEANADGLPHPRTEPVGNRFLVETK